jgi:hypothetical protein
MVYVDENFPLGNALAGLPEPLKAGAVGGNDTVKFQAALRLLEQAVGIKKFVLLRDGILVPANDLFALVLQHQRQPKLGANAIAIRPDVSDNAKGFVLADDFENAIYDFRVTVHA